jgi:hypothetical protein
MSRPVLIGLTAGLHRYGATRLVFLTVVLTPPWPGPGLVSVVEGCVSRCG